MRPFRGLAANLYFARQDLVFGLGRALAAPLLAAAARACFAVQLDRLAVRFALRASRLSDSRYCAALLRKHLAEVAHFCTEMLPSPQPLHTLDNRCVVLAEPLIVEGSVKRKGVLLVSFSDTAGILFASANTVHLARLFHVVLEPSSAGYANPDLLCWLRYPDQVIVQSSEAKDRCFLTTLNSNLIPVSYGAGDWVEVCDEEFNGLAQTKIYDAICVSNYGWWKRTHAFLKAVSTARRQCPDYRAALVLAQLGKCSESVSRLQALIDRYRLDGHIHVMEDLKRNALLEVYASSKVLVFPSWKEGSSRVLFEAMAVDLPVIVLKRNVGVNKEYIVPDTGMLVSERDLSSILVDLYHQRPQTRARSWFLEHLGPDNTTQKLVEDIRRLFPAEDWMREDMAVKVNAPEARIRGSTLQEKPLSLWLDSTQIRLAPSVIPSDSDAREKYK